jgi:hypothetical protein
LSASPKKPPAGRLLDPGLSSSFEIPNFPFPSGKKEYNEEQEKKSEKNKWTLTDCPHSSPPLNFAPIPKHPVFFFIETA